MDADEASDPPEADEEAGEAWFLCEKEESEKVSKVMDREIKKRTNPVDESLGELRLGSSDVDVSSRTELDEVVSSKSNESSVSGRFPVDI